MFQTIKSNSISSSRTIYSASLTGDHIKKMEETSCRTGKRPQMSLTPRVPLAKRLVLATCPFIFLENSMLKTCLDANGQGNFQSEDKVVTFEAFFTVRQLLALAYHDGFEGFAIFQLLVELGF